LRYIPLPMPVAVKASHSDLARLEYVGKGRGLRAMFKIPDDEDGGLLVVFDKIETFRVVDEMPLSTEAPAFPEGLVEEHVAYRVEDGVFRQNQSEAFHANSPDLHHYQFVTGWMCLDVLSYGPPEMRVERGET